MDSFLTELWTLWKAGGPLMIPLAALGLVIYFAIFELLLFLMRHNYYGTDQNLWGHWVDKPSDARGEIGQMIHFTQAGADSPAKIRGRFEELREAHLPRLQRRIHFCSILIGAAPLTGLLGTVMGMLNTFFGLSVSTAGNTIDLVAGGISEALITTQTGLVLAIPAYVFVAVVKRRIEQVEQFFTRLEILTILKFENSPDQFAKAS